LAVKKTHYFERKRQNIRKITLRGVFYEYIKSRVRRACKADFAALVNGENDTDGVSDRRSDMHARRSAFEYVRVAWIIAGRRGRNDVNDADFPERASDWTEALRQNSAGRGRRHARADNGLRELGRIARA